MPLGGKGLERFWTDRLPICAVPLPVFLRPRWQTDGQVDGDSLVVDVDLSVK